MGETPFTLEEVLILEVKNISQFKEIEEMREKARIHSILSLLEMIWQQQPDVRFNQLISNLQSLYSQRNNDYGKRKVTEKWDNGEVESSYLDFLHLEDTDWESFLKSLVENEGAAKEVERKLETGIQNENKSTGKKKGYKDKFVNDIEDNAITVVKYILAGKSVEEITKISGLSTKFIEKIKMGLLEGTGLEQLMQQFTSYKKKKLEKEHIFYDVVSLNSKFNTAISHEECTHFFIEENDKEKLSDLNLTNNKLYALHYDSDEDDYYVINENGEHCYSVDLIVNVKMLKRVD
jgi:uncharacterized protein YihD (DUF1040 family)